MLENLVRTTACLTTFLACRRDYKTYRALCHFDTSSLCIDEIGQNYTIKENLSMSRRAYQSAMRFLKFSFIAILLAALVGFLIKMFS